MKTDVTNVLELIDMCIICIDFIKGKLTAEEARRNLVELSVVLDNDHVEEVDQLIGDKENPLISDT